MCIKEFLRVSYIVSLILLFIYKANIYDFGKYNDDDILLELDIPRINLMRKVYNINSSLNNVDKNVEILKNSNLDKNLYFLASHSGGGNASYFDALVYLEIGDFIWINKEREKYAFVIEEVFYIQKNGYFEVSYNKEGNNLFLITCSLKYKNKQLVIKSRLIYKC